jgi:hypothetical protein
VSGVLASVFFMTLGLGRALAARGELGGGWTPFGAFDVGALIFVLGLAGLTLSALYAGAASWLGAREAADASEKARGSAAYARAILGASGVAGALVVIMVGRDLSASGENTLGAIRLVHLFSYNYKRPWPPTLDFSGTLWAVTVLGAVFTAAMATRFRRHAVVALTASALWFTAWGLDVYFTKVSPHWGQRETTLAYYEAIQSKPGPLIAYQMNWKGENFYTSNHLPAFATSGKRFTDYITEEKRKGVKTFYFVLEHGRTGTLSNELGNPRFFEKVTTPALNNKFVLVRATFE